MGMEVEVSTEKMVAQIFCRATEATTASAFVYQGLEDCNALYAAFQGDRECPYGCLGRGSCIGVCPTQAIFRAPEGCITIDPDRVYILREMPQSLPHRCDQMGARRGRM